MQYQKYNINLYKNNEKLAVDRDEGDKKLVFCQWS